MSMRTQTDSNISLTQTLIEKISEQNDLRMNGPEFCLYEETDIEALETFLESTDGPLTTEFCLFETSVTIRKSREGEITAEVKPTNQPLASD
ncbi:hypothetical protein [Halorussus salinisoli]|uniref:hypothetical protein n=1 Tax=Halorussus salinisoli TaxID=2558242 RepID=UPI0010C1D630|nr:hypothetical protein [Halorussus salinisoli]